MSRRVAVALWVLLVALSLAHMAGVSVEVYDGLNKGVVLVVGGGCYGVELVGTPGIFAGECQ